MLVGLVSDTHGLVRPELFEVLEGVELILHAGDVGEDVLLQLRSIAPVSAVFGNTDAPGTPGLVSFLRLEIGGVSVHVSHGHELGRPTPEGLIERYDADVIVYGHTHKPLIRHFGRRLVVNPGAAGPARFNLKPSVGRMTVTHGKATVELIEL